MMNMSILKALSPLVSPSEGEHNAQSEHGQNFSQLFASLNGVSSVKGQEASENTQPSGSAVKAELFSSEFEAKPKEGTTVTTMKTQPDAIGGPVRELKPLEVYRATIQAADVDKKRPNDDIVIGAPVEPEPIDVQELIRVYANPLPATDSMTQARAVASAENSVNTPAAVNAMRNEQMPAFDRSGQPVAQQSFNPTDVKSQHVSPVTTAVAATEEVTQSKVSVSTNLPPVNQGTSQKHQSDEVIVRGKTATPQGVESNLSRVASELARATQATTAAPTPPRTLNSSERSNGDKVSPNGTSEKAEPVIRNGFAVEAKPERMQQASPLPVEARTPAPSISVITNNVGDKTGILAGQTEASVSVQEVARMNVPTTPQASALQASNTSPAAPVTVLETVGTQAWQKQMNEVTLQMVTNNQKELTLNVRPVELGPIQIQMSQEENRTQLTILTHNAQARAALEGALPQLRDAFQAQGLNLADATIQQQSSGAGQQEFQQRSSQQHQDDRHALTQDTTTNDEEPMQEPVSETTSPRGQVDLYA